MKIILSSSEKNLLVCAAALRPSVFPATPNSFTPRMKLEFICSFQKGEGDRETKRKNYAQVADEKQRARGREAKKSRTFRRKRSNSDEFPGALREQHN